MNLNPDQIVDAYPSGFQSYWMWLRYKDLPILECAYLGDSDSHWLVLRIVFGYPCVFAYKKTEFSRVNQDGTDYVESK